MVPYTSTKNPGKPGFQVLAEREGFEPSVGSHLRLISSQVHSTTLPPLRVRGKALIIAFKPAFWLAVDSVNRQLRS
jgi:hypothetical protein